jgi:mannose-6-phosphate isomerase-like protein (cupin superfamily)
MTDVADMTRAARSLEDRVVRYADLVPCRNAFIDTRTPGSSAKENFTIIGPGVSENPAQYIHIVEPHGFNIGGARQPPACVNSQHSHETAETFVIHTGQWRFDFGEHGTDASVVAGPGDIVSFPTNAFRGFINIGKDIGFLWSVLGGDDPGRVTWAPRVFELARDYGLILLENGALIDSAAGEVPPPDIKPQPATTATTVAAMTRIDQERANGLAVRGDYKGLPQRGLGVYPGVTETALVGPAAEGLDAGPLGWRHGYVVRRLDLSAGTSVPLHMRRDPEVLFVHGGTLRVAVDDAEVDLTAGDTITIPVGARRHFASGEGATVFVVRGGDFPDPAELP